jgi:hypothetical protein
MDFPATQFEDIEKLHKEIMLQILL